MDDELLKLIQTGKDGEMAITVHGLTGTIELETPTGPQRHVLKPLAELYGPGVNALTVDPTAPEYLSLFMGIEQDICAAWQEAPGLTDSQVLSALERLAINPETPPNDDGLVERVQLNLRLQLSLGNFSRRDVQRALRKLAKSVARHNREGGQYGYLTFIRSHLP